MTYLKNILLLLLLFVVFNIQGQQILGTNLVQNPSFEQYDTCPFSSGKLNLSNHWWGISTEYYNACALPGSFSVPNNFNGYQYAHIGVAYSGFIVYSYSPPMAYNNTYMESIKNLLKDSLIKDKHYCVNFYTSLSQYTFQYSQVFNSIIIFDSIGALFTAKPVKDSIATILCDTCAKFAKSVANIDTTNWLKISGSVIANGGEKYLTIGKFIIMIWQPTINCCFYVYIDDVSVCECSFEFNLGNDTTLCDGETLILYPNMPNAVYTWQDSSHANTYNVTKPGTYWVRAYFPDYDITTSSSINVTFDGECLKIPNVITPNNDGKNDNFVIENSEGWNIDVQIFNRWGTIVYQNNTYKNTWDGKEVADGVYYYIIKARNISNGLEKQYKGSVTVLR